jgi:basic membrane protein A
MNRQAMKWAGAIGAILLLAACSSGAEDSADAPAAASSPAAASAPSASEGAAAAEAVLPAALIIAQGGLGDQSYNDLANKGFQECLATQGLEGAPVESADVVGEAEQMLTRASQGDFGLVIDLEYSHGEILPKVAASNPGVDYAILNLEAAGDNVASVLFQEQEGSYLAGALSALMTSAPDNPKVNPEKVIGVIGGTKSAGIDKFLAGFMQGAKDTDPEVEVLVAYSDDFGDPAKGKQLAEAMFDKGADIVYAVAGGTGAGVIEAAKQANHYAVGVDTDQDGLAPGNVLTSMIKRADVAVCTLLEGYKNGSFPGGQTINLGLNEDAVGLSDFTYTGEEIPEEFKAKVSELSDGIKNGSIKVVNVVTDGYPEWFPQS